MLPTHNELEKLITDIFYITLILLVICFAFSLFKNIQYGVLWNDEAETAMYAERINRFGYPKVYDGKNVLNVAETKDLSVGVKESIDAWIYISSWGQYYFAAPFVKLADSFSNIYTRTAILRVPFTFLGFIGVLIFGLSGSFLFKDRFKRLVFMNLFVLFEFLSIPLALHLREMRHYSLTIFLTSIIFFIQVKKFMKVNLNTFIYQFSMFLLLVFLLNVYMPAFVSVYAYLFFIFTYRLINQVRENESLLQIKKMFIKDDLYLFLVLIILFPYLYFFEFFRVSSAISEGFNFGLGLYFINLKTAISFFMKSDFFLITLFLQFLIIIESIKSRELLKIRKVKASLFLSFYVFISLLVVSRIPYFFERYYIFIQPFITCLLLVNLFVVHDFVFGLLFSKEKIKNLKPIFLYLVCLAIMVNSVFFIDPVRDHVYELFHPYKGPMDYAVAYILSNYKNPSKLIIATNYEEYVLMYYLKSKVVVGYVGNNLEDDLRAQPDIIIPRRGRPNFVGELNSFLEKGNYQGISSPVYDYQVNNIPDQTIPLKHLYRTKFAEKESERLKIYVKEN